jgi:general secretion pathway protein G
MASSNTQRRRRRSERGYSLLEVLIVLTIIALIAALVGPRLMAQLDRSKVTAARVQLRALASAIETMRIDIGRYPSDEEGFNWLVQQPRSGRLAERWQGPYLEGELPLDPWGGPYVYLAPPREGGSPRLVSYGADGEEGGSGLAADITYGAAQ